MTFGKPADGALEFNIFTGKLQIDAQMFMRDGGGLDMGVVEDSGNPLPEIEINAVTCQEGQGGFDDGIMDVNTDFHAMGLFHIGPQCFEGSGPCDNSNGPMDFDVAPGVVVSFAGTLGACPSS